MPRPNIYLAKLTAISGPACKTRYFTGYNRRAMHRTLARLANEASDDTSSKPLEMGIWSIHAMDGSTLEAHMYFSETYAKWHVKWHSVNKAVLGHHDLNAEDVRIAKSHCDTIGSDGTITENNR